MPCHVELIRQSRESSSQPHKRAPNACRVDAHKSSPTCRPPEMKPAISNFERHREVTRRILVSITLRLFEVQRLETVLWFDPRTSSPRFRPAQGSQKNAEERTNRCMEKSSISQCWSHYRRTFLIEGEGTKDSALRSTSSESNDRCRSSQRFALICQASFDSSVGAA
jgi:hypothetical protein